MGVWDPTAARVGLSYARFLLELAIVVGCFWVILTPSDQPESVAAFGLLGAITASIIHNLAGPERR